MAAEASPRGAWIWPWRPGERVGRTVLRWAGAADTRWWPLAALAIGSLPVLLGYAVGSSLHQPITALLLTPFFLSCLVRDRLPQAVTLVALTFGAHSVAVIAMTVHDPAGMAAILPGSEAYWQRTWRWVSTGEDIEYRWSEWLPAHGLLLVLVPVGAYTSFGAIPFASGLEQVDLMNFYVGRLISVSDSPARAILFGWHPWSVLRGLAFTVLVFEVSSWSLSRLCDQPLSTPRRRAIRWAAGLSLAVLDGLVKLLLAPTIREQLFGNLSNPAA